MVADKTKYALDKGLKVILCVGETLEQREAGSAFSTIAEQLKPVASKVSSWNDVVIAYEPVWAIGTGKVATPEQVGCLKHIMSLCYLLSTHCIPFRHS